MELLSNLVWVAAAVGLLGVAFRGVRRGRLMLPMGSALMVALLVGFILLPVISVSDDLLDSHQAALPQSAQTWRMATEAVAAGCAGLAAVCLYLLVWARTPMLVLVSFGEQWRVRPLAGRLARSQRLRPPPMAA